MTVYVEGPAPLRVESRPLVSNASEGVVGYVIELLLDGRLFRFEASDSEVDPSVALEGYLVGDRDRDKYVLPSGSHVLEVRYLEGAPRSLLVRVRQPESGA